MGGKLTNGKQHMDVQTRTEERDGAGRQSTETKRRVKDIQAERVTECSPERESVWVNVRAVLANSSVNLNL